MWVHSDPGFVIISDCDYGNQYCYGTHLNKTNKWFICIICITIYVLVCVLSQSQEQVINVYKAVIFGCLLQFVLLLWEGRRGSSYPEKEGDYGLYRDDGVHRNNLTREWFRLLPDSINKNIPIEQFRSKTNHRLEDQFAIGSAWYVFSSFHTTK